MDPRVIKKTQDTLGKIIKKPPLTEKLLNKPPFRFLHDIMTSVIKTTGFMKGLYTEEELNSENVKDKDSKIAFLQKAVDFTSMVTGKSLSVKPGKVVAGHEPEKTNEFLQALAAAINKGVDSDEYVQKMKNGGGEPKEEKSKEERDGRKKRDSEEKRDREKSASREKSRDRHRDRKEGRERDSSREGREERHKDKEERHRDKEDRHKDKEDRHRDREDREDRHRDRGEKHKDRDERKRDRRKHHDDESKENEPAMMNGEKEESPTKLARPSSAKGSRRRREGRRHDSDEEDEPPKSMQVSEERQGDDNVPPQVSAARGQARPSSARPAPPRRKQDTIENEPAMRLGSGKPANVIVDDGKDDSDDDDEGFMVAESAPPAVEPDQPPVSRPEDDEDEDHGGLVKKMLETKKELETGSQVKKTEIERPKVNDALRMKERQVVQKEIDKLRVSIQTLTRSANPLGKIMDYVQEDLDSMQKELSRWKSENKEHAMELKRERSITDKAIEPLRAQLAEVDQAIKDQLDLIAATKCNIMRNDQKIEKMLRSIATS